MKSAFFFLLVLGSAAVVVHAVLFFKPRVITVTPATALVAAVASPQGEAVSPSQLTVQRGNANSQSENFCNPNLVLSSEDRRFCFQPAKLVEPRGIAVDLSANRVLLYDQTKLVNVMPLAYQAQEGKWFQSPTGYYRIGVKKEKHLSSIVSVWLPYAIQYYEDFFLHGIPYTPAGERLSSQFTGGCLRLKDDAAAQLYTFAKTGDQIVVYKTFEGLQLKSGFRSPVDLGRSWIRQRFNNPYRKSWAAKGENLRDDYYHHTGVDIAPVVRRDAGGKIHYEELEVYAIADGRVVKVQANESGDHGMGNTVIIEHEIGGEKFYSSSAHMAEIRSGLVQGLVVKKGEVIGKVGNTAYGCDFWRIGQDGCGRSETPDVHLHFEIKGAGVLENPLGGNACRARGKPWPCYGYTPNHPTGYGYSNPIEFLFENTQVVH